MERNSRHRKGIPGRKIKLELNTDVEYRAERMRKYARDLPLLCALSAQITWIKGNSNNSGAKQRMCHKEAATGVVEWTWLPNFRSRQPGGNTEQNERVNIQLRSDSRRSTKRRQLAPTQRTPRGKQQKQREVVFTTPQAVHFEK
jgi:hypothetical protein